jgi:hypothetical protein
MAFRGRVAAGDAPRTREGRSSAQLPDRREGVVAGLAGGGPPVVGRLEFASRHTGRFVLTSGADRTVEFNPGRPRPELGAKPLHSPSTWLDRLLIAWAEDPDGHLIQVVQDLPKAT